MEDQTTDKQYRNGCLQGNIDSVRANVVEVPQVIISQLSQQVGLGETRRWCSLENDFALKAYVSKNTGLLKRLSRQKYFQYIVWKFSRHNFNMTHIRAL